MNHLRHIIEPAGLLLTWQPADEQSSNRTRRAVAKIEKESDGSVSFRYLIGTPDYNQACTDGFQGHPAFSVSQELITSGVTEALLRRLPPRKREDFSDFLTLHRLPHPFEYSDFALLAYTGARLPSDGFAIVPIFEPGVAPCDYILEIAGFRHALGANTADLNIDDPVDFVVEEGNEYDPGAISITHKDKHIGYVNRLLKDTFKSWMETRKVAAKIERINGKPNRPLVYLRVEITC